MGSMRGVRSWFVMGRRGESFFVLCLSVWVWVGRVVVGLGFPEAILTVLFPV